MDSAASSPPSGRPVADIVEVAGAPYVIDAPERQAVPVVMGVPHAGRRYLRAFVEQSRLPLTLLRRSEDAFVDLLTEDAPALGAPRLIATFPRAYIDVNREPYELDPRMIEGRLPGFANTRSLRVAGGLGTIPRIVGEGQDIYKRPIPVAEALARIDACYRPYHAALRGLVSKTQARFGLCVLLDMHSMPSVGLDPENGGRCDIILGDRFGTSAGAHVTQAAEDAFRHAGLIVGRNRPYAGGYITEHYGQPRNGVHAVQVEINRGLYMNEALVEPARVDALRRVLRIALERMFHALGPPRAETLAAAE
jgi:N-formylglutamate amidohydrolase